MTQKFLFLSTIRELHQKRNKPEPTPHWGGACNEPQCKDNWVLFIPTLESPHEASPGDWIIKGIKGEFYPCKPGIFAEIYERV